MPMETIANSRVEKNAILKHVTKPSPGLQLQWQNSGAVYDPKIHYLPAPYHQEKLPADTYKPPYRQAVHRPQQAVQEVRKGRYVVSLTPKPKAPLAGRYRVATVFYMPTRRRVDLTNLMEAAHDTLVAAKILADDNNTIIASVDGSRVMYDKENPRTEIFIEELEV